jgi:Protein of unknown function (DUF1579)
MNSFRESRMLKLRALFALSMIICVIGAMAIAGDHDNEKPAMDMSQMGAPEEMKNVQFLIGTWDVEQEWKMDPSSDEWTKSKAKCVFMDVYNGCALHQTYESEMMGMPFKGSGMIAYSNSKNVWQSLWFDNMHASIGYYEGDFKNDKFITSGEEIWNGQPYIARMTSYNLSEAKFDWTFEMSMDGGKNYITAGKAIYTKVK